MSARHNFMPQLTTAINKAPLVELTAGKTVVDEGWYKGKMHPYSKLRDDDLIDFGKYENMPYQVTTIDMLSYPTLLEQTLVALDKASGRTNDDLKADEYETKLAFIHETEHAEALWNTGAKNEVVFGVFIFKVERNQKIVYGYYGFMQPEGKVSKINTAKMYAAPSKLSESDRQKIIDLGYKLSDLKSVNNT